MVPHAVDNGGLGGPVKSWRVLECHRGLPVLRKLDGKIAVVRDVDVDVERTVPVDGASEVGHLPASPGVASAVRAHFGVHGTGGELVSIGLEDVELDARVASVHECRTVVAVEVTAAHQRSGNNKVQVGIYHVVDFAQVDGEAESTSEKVQLLLRVVTHASRSREPVSYVLVTALIDEVARLRVAWGGGWPR